MIADLYIVFTQNIWLFFIVLGEAAQSRTCSEMQETPKMLWTPHMLLRRHWACSVRLMLPALRAGWTGPRPSMLSRWIPSCFTSTSPNSQSSDSEVHMLYYLFICAWIISGVDCGRVDVMQLTVRCTVCLLLCSSGEISQLPLVWFSCVTRRGSQRKGRRSRLLLAGFHSLTRCFVGGWLQCFMILADQ